MGFWDAYFGGGGGNGTGISSDMPADTGGMTSDTGAEMITGSGGLEPSGTPGYGATGTPTQRQGLLALLSQYGSKLGKGGLAGLANQNAPIGDTTSAKAGAPASASMPWDTQSPDAMAKAQSDWQMQQMWEGLAKNVGKTVSSLYGGGAASSI